MTQTIWRYLRGGERGGRRSIIIGLAAYALLSVIAAVFLMRLQQAESRIHDFLATDDQSMFNRTSVEYARAVEALLRAAATPKPGDTDRVRERLDILHNRLNVFQSGTDATRFADGLPAFNRFVTALAEALRVSDAVLAGEKDTTLSPAANARLLSTLDALRPRLEATVAGVLASSAEHRDALENELEKLRTLMNTSVIAFVLASLLYIAYLGGNNRVIAAANRELRATATLLSRSEARLNAFLHNAPAVMTIADRRRRFEMVNARAERFYGLAAPELMGRRGDEVNSTAGQLALEELKQSVIDSGQPQSRQIRHETPSGEMWSLNVAFPILNAAGEIDAIGGIALDISDLKKSEAEVIRQRERAEAASQTKSRMLANASHELRTPLNAILGFGQVIEAEMFGLVGTAVYREYAADIVRSGRHLIGVIDTVLDLSRLETGQSELQEERCTPSDVIAAAVTLVEGFANQRGLSLAVEAGKAPDIIADRGKLTQAVVNLLSNAIKFTERGGRIAVSCCTGRADGGEIEIVVADSGIGISSEEIDRVVLPFTRGGSAMVRQQEGTGLGLAITKALVEQHGGVLELESTLGAGTRATIRLPASRIAPAQVQSRSA